MRYIIFDLEATCWQDRRASEQMETIEIGAVEVDENGVAQNEFGCFVRPFAHPKLSEFCTQLTSITQSEVDGAESFAQAFARFVAWVEASDEPFALVSWGAYDPRQLQTDCARSGVEYPATFWRHINLKKVFGAAQGVKPPGMKRALEMLGLPLEGTHHRGIDDARNIAAIAARLLPSILAIATF